MSIKNQGVGIFEIPGGEVTAYAPDGTMRAHGDGQVLSNLMDGSYAHGGPNACADGGAFGYAPYDQHAGDTTNATPRRPPDYGGFAIAIKS